MKNLILVIFSLLLILSSCKTTQMNSVNDDVYADPVDQRKMALAQAAAIKKKQADQAAAAEASRVAQKAKDDANPYYKDPQYNNDDYYDYAYASRARRFQTPVSGAGYYDNYYTNSYMYNQNPSSYGSSIYSSYNWWDTPGMNTGYGNSSYMNNGMGYNNGFGMSYGSGYGMGYNNGFGMSYGSGYGMGYNNGFGMSYGAGYGGYNPYGYSSFGYNPYGYNTYYQPWGMYGNSYMNNPWGYNPYGYGNSYGNSSWGYYNSYDVNSNYTYAPRESSTGGNSTRASYAGMAIPKDLDNNDRVQFINSMVAKQDNTPRFTNVVRTNPNPSMTNPNAVGGNGNNSFNSANVSNPNLTSGSQTNSNGNMGGNTGRHNTTFTNSSPVETNPVGTNPTSNTGVTNTTGRHSGFWSNWVNNNTTQVDPTTETTTNPRSNQNPGTGTRFQEQSYKPQENTNSFYNRSSGSSSFGTGGFGGGGSMAAPRGGGGGGGRPR